MSVKNQIKDINPRIKEKFIKDYLPQKYYHRHSDIDIFVNITITQLLNYNTLLNEECNKYIQSNFNENYNYNYYDEINEQKKQELEKIKAEGINNNNKNEKKSILSFDFPEFEIYFIAKLYVDGMERKPECQTKLLFNSKSMNQYISMRFKYKDLTTDSYINLELYSMQLPEDKSLLGTTKIFLFDDNLNLFQGRHIFQLNKTKNNNEEKNKNNINNNIININKKKIPYDEFLNNFNNKLKNYQKLYSESKFSRKIEFYTNLGYCHITLSFKNGNFDFVVTPLSYLIIQFFDEENKKNFKLFNIDYISEKLHSESLHVKQSLDFWLSKGVLKKVKKENSNDFYYEPNDVLNVGDEHEIIVEEKIYNFEYPKDISNSLLIENSIMSIIRNGGPKNFEQLYKNLIYSYKLDISEIKLKDLLWKMTLEQKICKDSENYKLIVVN